MNVERKVYQVAHAMCTAHSCRLILLQLVVVWRACSS